ncbi:MAG: Uma2 family endonuclease [Gammaproteobacteria bacterium]|nr:Uma2 family endonuclease [Gammaproteobacteria bacterium]
MERMDNTPAISQEAADAILLDVRPPQGRWREFDYLWLTDRCNRFVEFADGHLEELPSLTDLHQSILLFLFRRFDESVRAEGGVALVGPLRLKIREERFREPDLLLLRDASDSRRQNRFWLGADLVVEVVSPDDPERDYVRKRHDYATARISEYWIVDPQRDEITVMNLEHGRYVERGTFGIQESASSSILDGFNVEVSEALQPDDID